MSTFFVTGGAGYVGSHTVKALAAEGHRCVVFDNLSTGHRDFVQWGPLVHGDIRDASALESALREHQPQAVIHFAARAYVADSVGDPGAYYDVNVNGTRCLLNAMARAGVGRIVFSSSCAVYGTQGIQPITELSEPKPINPYGFTKLICERMMDDYGAAHQLRSIKLRYFNAAGADPDLDIGEHHDPEPHLIPLVLQAAANGGVVQLFGTDYDTPDGSAVRDYVHVTDLASAHIAAATALVDGATSMTLNLGTGAGASVRDVIAGAEAITGASITVAEAERRPGDPAMLIASPTLARRTLKWAPSRSELGIILSDAWRWRQKRFGDQKSNTLLTNGSNACSS